MAITYLSWSGQLKTAEVFKPVHDEMAKALHFDAAESMLEPGESSGGGGNACRGWP